MGRLKSGRRCDPSSVDDEKNFGSLVVLTTYSHVPVLVEDLILSMRFKFIFYTLSLICLCSNIVRLYSEND